MCGMPAPVALLIEDSKEYALIGTKLLQREGFDVVVAHDGETGLRLARSRKPELVLLDVGLPGVDGFEVCRRLRDFSDAYLIMVTGRGDEVDRVVGLTVGADDYVTKPFSARELAARIAAMRRRPRAAADPGVWDFGPLRVDVAARETTLDGRLLDLTKVEFDLLAKLASEPSCSRGSGAPTGTATTTSSTSTSGTCARSSASPGRARGSCTPCAVSGSASSRRRGAERRVAPPLNRR
jgi:DNA-binding response OmpR family regulator